MLRDLQITLLSRRFHLEDHKVVYAKVRKFLRNVLLARHYASFNSIKHMSSALWSLSVPTFMGSSKEILKFCIKFRRGQ